MKYFTLLLLFQYHFVKAQKSDSAAIIQLLKEDYATMQDWNISKHISNCTSDYLLIENGEIWDLQKEVASYKANASRNIQRTDSFNIIKVKVAGNMAYDVHHLQSVIVENNHSVTKDWNESVVFRKEAGRWKIAMIHSSLISSGTGASSLDHVALYVRDMRRSVHFYTTLFQFDTIPVPPHGSTIVTWFRMNENMQLHLVQGLKDSLNIPFTHIAFSVPSLDDFIDKLKPENITWFGGKGNFTIDYRADGVHQIYFKDPDGYEIEVNDRKH